MPLQTLEGLWENAAAYFTDSERWLDWALSGLKILLIYIAAKVILRMLSKTIAHLAVERDRFKVNPRRSSTIVALIGNVARYVVNFMMILLILNEIGLPLGPLLTGAGVVGLAIGFGAQSLVKDVITGFFIIFEDQFAVGDIVKIGTYEGTVVMIGLRVTKIRSRTGEVHIIPNGAILQVTNYSINSSLAVVDVTIPANHDYEAALQGIEEIAAALYRQHAAVVGSPSVLGIQSLTNTEAAIRVTIDCKPGTRDDVARQLLAELRKSPQVVILKSQMLE